MEKRYHANIYQREVRLAIFTILTREITRNIEGINYMMIKEQPTKNA